MTTMIRWSAASCLAAAALLSAAPAARAQSPSGRPEIYSCDVNGKRITRDRYIAECSNQPQRVLNSDGSFNRTVPPTLTSDERSLDEAREIERLARVKCMQVEARRDRGLMTRYPNEAAHRKARDAALDDNVKAMRASDERMANLKKDRKPLSDEAEFYAGKTMPTKLKTQLDTNDALVEAQRALMQNQATDLGRINQNFDTELAHLKKLWAGAEPGFEASCGGGAGTPPAKR